MSITMDKPPNPWGRISKIAARLGVEPSKRTGTITALGDDGEQYDIWEVLAALLDRMDKAAQQ